MKSTINLMKYLAICLLLAACSSDDQDTKMQQQLPSVNTVEAEILQLVNAHRQSIGKASLSAHNLADDLARTHTVYMIDQREISHDNFNSRAQQLQQEAGANGVGENVAAGQPSAQSVMNAWLNSSGHRANIEGNYTHIGVSAIKNEGGTYYYTQLFFKQ